MRRRSVSDAHRRDNRRHATAHRGRPGWGPAARSCTDGVLPDVAGGASASVVPGPTALDRHSAGAFHAPPGGGPDTSGTVQAVLIRPAWGCTPNQAWGTLNTDWPSYGSTPVSISTTSRLCDGTFTLKDLERSGADTLIFSAAASDSALTASEVDAIATYAEQGHTLLATSLTFGLGGHDNNALAPLFGLAEQTVWRESGDSGAPFSY